VIDLMEALRASLERKGTKPAAVKAAAPTPRSQPQLKVAEPEARKPPKRAAAAAVPKKVRSKA